MKELREIIQEAWCAGNKLETGDTFGAFLDRAANAIRARGYCKVEGKPPLLSDKKIEILWRPIFTAHGFSGIYEASRVVAQAHREKDIEFYDSK